MPCFGGEISYFSRELSYLGRKKRQFLVLSRRVSCETSILSADITSTNCDRNKSTIRCWNIIATVGNSSGEFPVLASGELLSFIVY